MAENRISQLRAQAERIATSITTLLDKGNLKDFHRRQAIYRRVSQHLKEVQEQTDHEDREFGQMADRLAALHEYETELAGRIIHASRQVGVKATEPADAERELHHIIATCDREGWEEDDSFF